MIITSHAICVQSSTDNNSLRSSRLEMSRDQFSAVADSGRRHFVQRIADPGPHTCRG
jgi:hypothetical protein